LPLSRIAGIVKHGLNHDCAVGVAVENRIRKFLKQCSSRVFQLDSVHFRHATNTEQTRLDLLNELLTQSFAAGFISGKSFANIRLCFRREDKFSGHV